MIPKIIHYMWFGENPLPESTKKYIESWKKFCPEYAIKEWNEHNFDINSCRYVAEAYLQKKWAFVADYVRFYVLYNEGGIYLDTDMEMVRSFEPLRKHKAFFGFATDGLTLPVFGSEAKTDFIADMLDDYHKRSFIKLDGRRLVKILGEKLGLYVDAFINYLFKDGLLTALKKTFSVLRR